MSKDVFVSYSSEDMNFADEVREFLERAGIACWIAPRDVTPGAEIDEAILDAIESTEAMILILSSNANASPFVKNEVNLAFTKGKTIFTFRMQDVLPGKSLAFYLARHHWTDGFPLPLNEKVQRLAVAILALLGKPSPFGPVSPQTEPSTGAIGHPVTTSLITPTTAEIETLVASPDAETQLTAHPSQSIRKGNSSPHAASLATGPTSMTDNARTTMSATAKVKPSPPAPATDDARTAVRHALSLIILTKSTSWGSVHVSDDNSARVWPDLVSGNIAPIVSAMLEVLDDPRTTSDDRWKVITLLRFAIRTPVGRACALHIAERVARHLTATDPVVQKCAGEFVEAAPVSANEKWEFIFMLFSTASGRQLWTLIPLAEKFCPFQETEKLCSAMLDVLEFDTKQAFSTAYAVLSKSKYVNGFGRLREIACCGDLDKAYYACRLLSEMGDLAAGPAIRQAISNHRFVDNLNIVGLLKSLLLVEKLDAISLISEVVVAADRKIQVLFLNEGIGSGEEPLREVAKQLMDTSSDQELQKAGAKYLAKR